MNILFLADENFPLPSTLLLRKEGLNIISATEDKLLSGTSDVYILQQACEQKRIILTYDKDYGTLIFKKKLLPPPGIVFFRLLPGHPEEPAELLIPVLREGKIILLNKFTTVDNNKIRQRPLKEL